MTTARRERWRVTIGIGLLALGAVYCAKNIRIADDLYAFLPVGTDDQTAELSRALALADASRLLVFTVDAQEATEAQEAADLLVEHLAEHAAIAWVEGGPDPDFEAEAEHLLFSRRYQLLGTRPDELASNALSNEALHTAAARLRDSLLTPLSPLVSRIADRDPLLVFPSLLARLSGLRFGDLVVEDGRYTTADRRAAVVLCATSAGVLDSARQSAAIVEVEEEIAALHRHFKGRIAIEYTGIGRFAVRSQELMLADATYIGAISTVAVLAVFVAVLGSVRLLLASMSVVAAGLVSGLAAVLLVYGQIHALTLGIGMTLIGVCEDYPVHYFNHWLSANDRASPRAKMRKLWPALFLGGATTAVGFASLGLTSYAGLREVAVFAGAGVLGALAVTWLLLPGVATSRPRSNAGRRVIAKLSGALSQALAMRSVRRVAAIVVLGAVVLGCARVTLDRSLASLNLLDPAMVEVDARIRERAGTTHPGRVVVAVADSDEAAMRSNDRIAERLREYVAQDRVDRFASVHALLWSEELQRKNFAVVRGDATFGFRAVEALESAGFRGTAFEPFVRELSALTFDPLTFDSLGNSSLARVAASFRVPVGDKVGLVTLVAAGTDPAVLREVVSGIEGAIVFDQKQAIDDAYSGYQSELARVLCVGMIAVFLLTLAQYRNLARAGMVCIPAIVAIAFTVSVLAICGVVLNMMHLAALVLVFAMGVDYAIFLEQSKQEADESTTTVGSIWVAGTTTILGFGLLAMSEIPALRSIGQTTGLGIAMSAVLALILRPTAHADRGSAT